MVEPFQLYKININVNKSSDDIKVNDEITGDIDLVRNERLNEKCCDGIKGGSIPISYKDGHLAIVHYTTRHLLYYHRFVFWDENYESMKMSMSFCFEAPGVEFCLGMCHDHGGSGVIITHSVKDNFARAVCVDYDVIDDYFDF